MRRGAAPFKLGYVVAPVMHVRKPPRAYSSDDAASTRQRAAHLQGQMKEAVMKMQEGDLNEAEFLIDEAVLGFQELLGEEHAISLLTMSVRARVLTALGEEMRGAGKDATSVEEKLDAAAETYEYVISGQMKTSGKHHEQTLRAKKEYAQLMQGVSRAEPLHTLRARAGCA